MLTLSKIYAVKTIHPQSISNLKSKIQLQSAKIRMFCEYYFQRLLKALIVLTPIK